MIRFICAAVLKTVFRLRGEGLENIPRTGALIIACNHLSEADPPALDVLVTKIRPVRFMAKVELFRVPFIGGVMKSINAIPVDRKREGGDLNALRRSVEALVSGECVAIFPEGTRAANVRLEPKSGIGFIACKSGAQVVPAHITGSDRFPYPARISVKFGKPFSWSDFISENGQADKKESYKLFSLKVMDEIEKL
ncbi:MAG: lysophospholipid acyltransferase family protein [Elusimicrobiaceae bacterium]